MLSPCTVLAAWRLLLTVSPALISLLRFAVLVTSVLLAVRGTFAARHLLFSGGFGVSRLPCALAVGTLLPNAGLRAFATLLPSRAAAGATFRVAAGMSALGSRTTSVNFLVRPLGSREP